MSTEGLVIVISAPSGAGKSTLCNLLVEKLPDLKYSISYTTRPRRQGEEDGADYFFVSEKEFKRMERRGAFVEWARVHDSYYGTPKSYLKKVIRSGKDIILDIDVQGGLRIRRIFPRAVMIFIMTGSLKELERRLQTRNKDSEEVIRKRLFNARKELRSLTRYDYLVINDDLPRAVQDLQAIITAEHRKIRNLPPQKFK